MGVGKSEIATTRILYFFSSLEASAEQSIEHGLTIYAPQNVFGGKYIHRVQFLSRVNRPIYTPKTNEQRFRVYILTTNKAIITKLDPNIKEVNYCHIFI